MNKLLLLLPLPKNLERCARLMIYVPLIYGIVLWVTLSITLISFGLIEDTKLGPTLFLTFMVCLGGGYFCSIFGIVCMNIKEKLKAKKQLNKSST
jgi:hypothetical protein